MSMFETAARLKLRFPHAKGQLNCEDLFDLSVEELDSIYKTLSKQQKEAEVDSLLEPSGTLGSKIELQIDIIKHIVNVKQDAKRQAEEKAVRSELAHAAQKELKSRQANELKTMTDEELQALANQ